MKESYAWLALFLAKNKVEISFSQKNINCD